ncbi:uncharacterized protein PgNI_07967 [Pyricularia grisea]|uniref:Secreted protein n=1 Tax=Pyricularia grisea TaxID=148305 RepID=A0A6P8B181_PYRGI|nr:uncharacterized protein PgNI_07967 [Pyricularia grisea]TLD08612.1 hypothetical protein PgNI_07967 [Pyricularia grisea]
MQLVLYTTMLLWQFPLRLIPQTSQTSQTPQAPHLSQRNGWKPLRGYVEHYFAEHKDKIMAKWNIPKGTTR